MQITKQVTFIAHEHSVEKLRELLTTMIQASKDEDGCLLYDIFQYEDEPTKFTVIESWENEAALNGHKLSAHYKHYKATYVPYTTEKYSSNLITLA